MLVCMGVALGMMSHWVSGKPMSEPTTGLLPRMLSVLTTRDCSVGRKLRLHYMWCWLRQGGLQDPSRGWCCTLVAMWHVGHWQIICGTSCLMTPPALAWSLTATWLCSVLWGNSACCTGGGTGCCHY